MSSGFIFVRSLATAILFFSLSVATALPLRMSPRSSLSPRINLSSAKSTSSLTGLNILDNELAYSISVQIGNPATSYNLMLDTLSSQTWLPSQSCTTCGPHTLVPNPDLSASDAQTQTLDIFSSSYGSSSVSISPATVKNVQIGELKLGTVPMYVAAKEDSATSGAAFDGVLALSPNSDVASSLSEVLQLQPGAPHLTVAFKLPSLSDGNNNAVVSFTGFNQLPVNPSTIFSVPNAVFQNSWGFSSIPTVNGLSVFPSGSTSRMAVLDTASDTLLMPQADLNALAATIPGAKVVGAGMTVPCDMSAIIAVVVDETALTMNPADFVGPSAGGDGSRCFGKAVAFSGGGGDNVWQMGIPFLKNFFVSLDFKSRTVLFAV